MLFPKIRGLWLGRFLATAFQRWEQSRRARRLAQGRPRQSQLRRAGGDYRGHWIQVQEPRAMLTDY
jgi:hypothetical protein